ncbi:MAG: hypothetical protein LDL33_06055 [Desulfomonile sp.]|nr:hypothetical protein [Desulfomonile sp.]
MTALVLRPASSKDIPQVREILRQWTSRDPSLREVEALLSQATSVRPQCTILECAGSVLAVCVWQLERPAKVAIAALASTEEALKSGAAARLLQEEIVRWSAMGVATATICLPEGLPPTLTAAMRTCGFLFEGISCGCDEKPRITLAKHFLYRVIPQSEVLPFLREFMISLGYDVQQEGTGFRYRVRDEYLLPFIFSPWHKITKSGSDIIMHPPARVLQPNELETLFYPLRVHSRNERPLLLALDKKTAENLISLPAAHNHHQNSLFDAGEASPRIINLNAVAYSQPPGPKSLRKGLSVLFYVGRIGAVGVARVEDSSVYEQKGAPQNPPVLERPSDEDPLEPTNHKQRCGKALAVRFQWYRPLRSPVSLEKIRTFDAAFNPQRMRSVSASLFEAIVREGDRIP